MVGRNESVDGRPAVFAVSQDRIGQQAGLVGVSEFLKARLGQVEPFTGPQNPVVERTGNGQVGATGASEEKFAVARCRSPSIRLLSRQVQFDRWARSPAVSPAASISSKIASA